MTTTTDWFQKRRSNCKPSFEMRGSEWRGMMRPGKLGFKIETYRNNHLLFMFVWHFEVLTRFMNDSLISKLIWKSPVLKKPRGIKLQEIWISLKMGRWEINLRIKISNTKLWSFICSKVYCDYLLSHWCMRLIIKVSGETLINTWGMNTLMTELSSILLLMLISLYNHTSWLTSHWFSKSAGCAHFQCLSYFFDTLGVCFFRVTNWHNEVSRQEISGFIDKMNENISTNEHFEKKRHCTIDTFCDQCSFPLLGKSHYFLL